MVQTSESLFRPYAPPANVLACLHRLRRMNMPSVVTRDLLKSIGISENIVPRVFATLRFLDLVTDSSEPTDVLRGLAGSTEDEYRQLLEKTVRRAYADEFGRIDPSVDTQERVMNAFQRYMPRSQHNRQVMLFLGLCREAWIPTLDVPRRRGMIGRPSSASSAGRPAQPRASQAVRISSGTPAVLLPQADAGMLEAPMLGITLLDASHMPEDDFWEIWNSLGILFLRRAQRAYPSPMQSDESSQAKGVDGA